MLGLSGDVHGGGPPVRAELTLPREDLAELERRLVHWAQCTNPQQGVAPSTNMVRDVVE